MLFSRTRSVFSGTWIWDLIFTVIIGLALGYHLGGDSVVTAQDGTLPGGTLPPSPMVAPDFSLGGVHGLTLPDGPTQPGITMLLPSGQTANAVAVVTKGRDEWQGVKTNCAEFGTPPTHDGVTGNAYHCVLDTPRQDVSAIIAGEPEDDPEPSLLMAIAELGTNEIEFWPNCSLWRTPSSDGKVDFCDSTWTVPSAGLLSATVVVVGNDDDDRFLDFSLDVNGTQVELVSYDDPTIGMEETPTWDLGINASIFTTDVNAGDEVTLRVKSPSDDGDSAYLAYVRFGVSTTRLRASALRDRDADTIPDIVEGDRDFDGDGIQDSLDTDADNDNILDIDEAGSDPFKPRDLDGNGMPDYKQVGLGQTHTILLPLVRH